MRESLDSFLAKRSPYNCYCNWKIIGKEEVQKSFKTNRWGQHHLCERLSISEKRYR